METIVIRGEGNNEGPAVVDRLLTTSVARQERGRVEIDLRCSSREVRDIKTLDPQWLSPGTFVEISDLERGRVPGILTAISVELAQDGHIVKTLRVETEAP